MTPSNPALSALRGAHCKLLGRLGRPDRPSSIGRHGCLGRVGHLGRPSIGAWAPSDHRWPTILISLLGPVLGACNCIAPDVGCRLLCSMASYWLHTCFARGEGGDCFVAWLRIGFMPVSYGRGAGTALLCGFRLASYRFHTGFIPLLTCRPQSTSFRVHNVRGVTHVT